MSFVRSYWSCRMAPLGLAVGFCIALAGCGGGTGTTAGVAGLTAPANVDLTVEEQELRNLTRRNRQLEGAAVGCATAGVTALAGTLLFGNNKKALRNAAVSCVAGAVVGYAYGSYVDARSQAYANEQQRVLALSAGAADDVARYAKVNATTARLIASEKKRIADIEASQKTAEEKAALRKKRAAAMASNVKLLEDQVKEMDGNIATIDKDKKEIAAKGASVTELEQQRQALMQQKAELAQNIIVLKSGEQKTG